MEYSKHLETLCFAEANKLANKTMKSAKKQCLTHQKPTKQPT